MTHHTHPCPPCLPVQAKLRGSGALQLPGGNAAVYDEGTALRLLARRPERTGSKQLKTVYKLSKRLK